MVSKLDSQTYTSEFESHWVPHSFGLVLNRSKDLRKLLPLRARVDLGAMAIKGYSALPKAPALLEPHHQIV